GSVALVDFGAVRDRWRDTQVGGSTVVGTYGYMAPEQFLGHASAASDLFGLGSTLVFLLTQTVPAELPHRRLRVDFRSRVKLSRHFASWLEKMIEPTLEDRFDTATEALDALTRPALPRRIPLLAFAPAVLVAAALAWVMGGGGTSLHKGRE